MIRAIPTTIDLHEDDVKFFDRVVRVMRDMALKYELPLKTVVPLTDIRLLGANGAAGLCSHDGNIGLVLRLRETNGEWTAPVTHAKVWEVAAHELAHLKHFNHGPDFREFEVELLASIKQRVAVLKEEHRQRILVKLAKLKQVQEGEAAIGNTEAAETFAATMNRLMMEYELSSQDIAAVGQASVDEPIIELRADYDANGLRSKNKRSAWMESLASIVARANMCKILVAKGSNVVWFVGTKSHAQTAEYTFITLARAAIKMARAEELRFRYQVKKEDGNTRRAYGFTTSWLNGFIRRVDERLYSTRQEVVKAHAQETGMDVSQALVCLNTPARRVEEYLNGRFRNRGGASSLRGRAAHNAAGREAGRAAADRISLNKGVGAGMRSGSAGYLS